MRKLRRFIWYLAGRLLLITVLLGLFTVTFYYAMNASNIYIVLKDGMAKRAQVIMMGESPSELTKFFQGSYLQIDTTTILHFDMFQNAAAVEKLIGSGAFSIDDVLAAAGKPVIGEPWSQAHWLTLNISPIEKAAKTAEPS